MRRFVLGFKEINKDSLPEVGGKGANLGEMTKAGFPVPQGFCVTTSAHRALLETSGEMGRFFAELDRVHPEGLDEIRKLGARIRHHLERLPVPMEVAGEIDTAWRRQGMEKAYAVRSSATAEDLPGASFAGQQETYLNMRGAAQILDAVRRCWASLFTDRAIAYRAKNGFDHRQVLLSVVVQEMVFPDVSGILFTADPVTGNRNVSAIDAGFGLGEALVSGLVTADLYQVKDDRIVAKRLGEKKIAIYALPEGGTVTKDLPPERRQAQALPDEQIIRLARLGRGIEAHYGKEQDIEWCLADGRLFIVQSRPITSLYPLPKLSDARLHVYFSLGHQQMMTDALSPMGISVLRTLFPFGKSGAVRSESPAVLEAGSHLFFDPTELLYLKPGKRLIPRLLRAVDERIGSAVEEVVNRPEFQHPANRQVKRAIGRIARKAAMRLPQGFFTKDYAAVREDLHRFLDQQLQETSRMLGETTGAERIARLQESLGSVILKVVGRISPYMAGGMASKLLTEALVKRWLGDGARAAPLNKSLVGNVTSELGLQIGDLADIIREYPQVEAYLRTAEDGAFLEGLARVEGGSVFAEAFERFLGQYGMRCPGEIDIASTRWREAPTKLVPSLLSHMQALAPGEHRAKFRQGEREAAEAAEAILAGVRSTAGGRIKAAVLARLIRNYRNLAGLREFPKYFIIRHLDLYKRVLLEEGRHLAGKGNLASESDVFYLTLGELSAMADGSFAGDARTLVAARRRQRERDQQIDPPRVMTSEGEIVTGRRREVAAPAGALAGTPVSPGTAEGYAKVVLRPDQAKLKPGEILIAPFTDPGWTPLFHSAQGLVMEVGGLMTHGAVVAREYGIPAVVGIEQATKRIRDGAYIRVDGTNGYVQLLKEPEGRE